MSCNSASAWMPICSASLARGLSSDLRSPVSPGSTSFRRNLPPSVMRYGLERRLALLITRLVFITILSERSLIHFGEAQARLGWQAQVGGAVGANAHDHRTGGVACLRERRFDLGDAAGIHSLAAEPLRHEVPAHRAHLGAEAPSVEHLFVRHLHR